MNYRRPISIAVLALLALHSYAQSTQSTVNGIANQTISAAGSLPAYDLSGNIISGAKCFQGSVVSSANTGQWAAPSTPASLGLTSITSINATVLSPGGSLTSLGGQYGVSVQNATVTGINGTVTSPVAIVLGGISIGFGPSPATVFLRFCGATS